MRVICPQCSNKLSLHRPAVAATRIKCRNCGHKFYAGKAESLSENAVDLPLRATTGDAVAAGPAAAVMAPTDIAFDSEKKQANREVNRARVRGERRKKRLRWLVPSGIGALVIMVGLGLFFAPKPPDAPPPPTTSLLELAKGGKKFDAPSKSPPADSGALMINAQNVIFPVELVGAWTLQEPGGGVLEFRADGNARIKARLIKESMIELATVCFVIKVDGNEYTLDFGVEPYRNDNCVATVRLQSDGSLRMIRFGCPDGVNYNPRIFKKAG